MPAAVSHDDHVVWVGAGAIIGGVLGVELAKKIARVGNSISDAIVLPLILGMCIAPISNYD